MVRGQAQVEAVRGASVHVRLVGMRLDPQELRTAFRAVVGRIAVGDDEVARARWWRWVEEAAPPPRETNPGRLTVSLGDALPAWAVWALRRSAAPPTEAVEASGTGLEEAV